MRAALVAAGAVLLLVLALSASDPPAAHGKVDPLFPCPAIQVYPEDCKLGEITPANPGGCFAYTGIAFDATNLYVACQQNNIVAVVAPLDGHLIRSFTIPDAKSEPFIGAMAWDRNRNAIWACLHDNIVPNTGSDKTVALIDPNDGHTISRFTSDGCWTGLAYDGTDDTIWTSPDTSPLVSHWTDRRRAHRLQALQRRHAAAAPAGPPDHRASPPAARTSSSPASTAARSGRSTRPSRTPSS